MIVNKALMAKARFEKKNISDLTVEEFRSLMQQCFDANNFELQKRADKEFADRQKAIFGGYNPSNH